MLTIPAGIFLAQVGMQIYQGLFLVLNYIQTNEQENVFLIGHSRKMLFEHILHT